MFKFESRVPLDIELGSKRDVLNQPLSFMNRLSKTEFAVFQTLDPFSDYFKNHFQIYFTHSREGSQRVEWL